MSNNAKQGSNAIVPVEEYAVFMQDANDLSELIQENLGENGINANDLERITWPTGGNTFWQIPSIGSPEVTANLDGIIVGWQNRRAYWRGEYSGKAAIPDCVSYDGKFGMGDPGGNCDECPYAQWGSDRRGRGQACKNMRLLFIVRPNAIMPYVLQVPPTSIKPISKYFFRLLNQHAAHYAQVITRLTLVKSESEDGFTYAEVAPEMLDRLNSDEIDVMRNLAKTFRTGIATALPVVVTPE